MASSRPSPALAGHVLAALVSVALSAALFLAAEGALRLTGIGAPEASASRLAYQQIRLPLLTNAARADGALVRVTADPRLPFETLLASKPANGLRVITFGGSATAGLGFSPNVTFAHQLRRMLEEAYPDRAVEVLNLGIVALSSRQVKVLVANACEHYEPDAVVVYSGNNEFLEIHARKYAEADAALTARLTELLERTYLFRALRLALRGRPRPPSLADRDFSRDELRFTQDRIIERVELTPGEVAAVVDEYEANLDEMARVANATGTPLLFASVASNWKWRGRSDLPAGWMDELVPSGGADGERAAKVLAILDERLASAPSKERWELLFRRGAALEELGDWGAARASYRAALNQDPHLRRALDTMNERVREVAARRGVTFLDSVAALAQGAPHGIVGFDDFYDYVHYTPRGAVILADAMFRALVRAGALPEPTGFDPRAHRERELRALAALERDPEDVGEWMGVGWDPAGQIADRDLWKYDRLLGELDRRIEADPRDALALVYRGNANYFRPGDGRAAEADYLAALALRPDDPSILRNLERLGAERRLHAAD